MNQKTSVQSEIKRYGFGLVAAVIFAINLKTFVKAGGLFPGGFAGVTLLIQGICEKFLYFLPPYTLVNTVLNIIPITIGFKFIGKKFTVSSCFVILVTNLLTDLIPTQPITYDTLLISVFGGLINGFCVSLCLIGNTSTGGTDFIAIFFSERKGKDIWNFVFLANACVLAIAGLLFGWDAALYSIIFQFTSTQVVHMMHKRYKKNTLFIVTSRPDEVYENIRHLTRHSATRFEGKGCYSGNTMTLLYSVVSQEEAKALVKKVHEIDPMAFVNIIKTDFINGRFYQKTDY